MLWPETGVGQELVQQVAIVEVVPQMVVRVDDRQVRREDRLARLLGQPRLVGHERRRCRSIVGAFAMPSSCIRPHPEERAAGARLEGWATSSLLPTLRDAALRAAPQGEGVRENHPSLG